MKKATLASTAVWLAGALLMIGWQIAGQKWPVIETGLLSNAMILVCIGVLAASLGLMKSVDRRELFPSPLNTPARNALNLANIIAAIGAALGFFYLSGLFGTVDLHSALFAVAAAALFVGVATQAVFALVTRQRMSE